MFLFPSGADTTPYESTSRLHWIASYTRGQYSLPSAPSARRTGRVNGLLQQPGSCCNDRQLHRSGSRKWFPLHGEQNLHPASSVVAIRQAARGIREDARHPRAPEGKGPSGLRHGSRATSGSCTGRSSAWRRLDGAMAIPAPHLTDSHLRCRCAAHGPSTTDGSAPVLRAIAPWSRRSATASLLDCESHSLPY